jgi:hypothetical protein
MAAEAWEEAEGTAVADGAARMAEKMAADHQTAAMAINRAEAGDEAGECAAWPSW